jgi:secondary thiamine-phosphate synthase enzyme
MKAANQKSLSELRLKTTSRVEFVDITQQVMEAVRQHQVDSGICTIFCPHTTAGITINENADPDVPRDMTMALGRVVPATWEFRHSEGNSDSHVKSSLVGPSLTVIMDRGKPLLGTWQGIYFCEFDGPRERKFYVKTVRDAGE